MEVVIYDRLGDLPLFNPDLDTETPPAAVRGALRREIERCDGVLVCSPEYAHGIAGAMKNLLDWLVSSLEFPEKAVALINASPRAVHSQAQLREILTTMSARLIEDASIELPLQGRGLDAAGIVADSALSAALRGAVAHVRRSHCNRPGEGAVVTFLRSSPQKRGSRFSMKPAEGNQKSLRPRFRWDERNKRNLIWPLLAIAAVALTACYTSGHLLLDPDEAALSVLRDGTYERADDSHTAYHLSRRTGRLVRRRGG